MFYKLLMGNGAADGKKILHDGRKSFNRQEVEIESAKARMMLKHASVSRQDRILIINDNSADVVFLIMGCIALGVVFVIADSSEGEARLEYIAEDAEIKAVFGRIAEGKTCKWNFRAPVMDLSKREECFPDQEKNPEIDLDETGYILYTSGSTGKPKGVVACYRQMMFCVQKINARLCNGSADRILCALPLSFDYGLYQVFLAFASDAELYLMRTGALQKIPSVLAANKITALPVVPSMLVMLVKSRLLFRAEYPNLRYISSTGDVLPLSVIQEVHRQLPDTEIIPMYGLTECKRIAIMPFGRFDKTIAGSCGIPLDEVHVDLIDKDEKTGIGQLVVTGKNIMNGYWNDEEETAEYFHINPGNGEKMLYTGDLFRVDDEGFLYFEGRIKRMIKRNGIRIGNAEVESYFVSKSFCLEVCAVGVRHQEMGECIGVLVYSADRNAEVKIRETVAAMPMKLKPDMFQVTDVPLPKNANGKFDTAKIRIILQSTC